MDDATARLIFFVGAALAVAAVIILAVWLAERARREDWRALAKRLGCSFSARDPIRIPRAYPQSLFHHGHGRRASNVLNGEVGGHELMCFDYQYTVGSGDSQRTIKFTPLLLTPPIPFPPLAIRPETFLDRVGEFLGLDDIDFESDEFNRRFHVKCRDKRFAYDVIHPRAMELLLAWGKISIEAQGTSVLIYRRGRLRLPHEVEELIRRGIEFLDLIPNYLVGKAKGGN
jgi:hypothetical protein